MFRKDTYTDAFTGKYAHAFPLMIISIFKNAQKPSQCFNHIICRNIIQNSDKIKKNTVKCV